MEGKGEKEGNGEQIDGSETRDLYYAVPIYSNNSLLRGSFIRMAVQWAVVGDGRFRARSLCRPFWGPQRTLEDKRGRLGIQIWPLFLLPSVGPPGRGGRGGCSAEEGEDATSESQPANRPSNEEESFPFFSSSSPSTQHQEEKHPFPLLFRELRQFQGGRLKTHPPPLAGFVALLRCFVHVVLLLTSPRMFFMSYDIALPPPAETRLPSQPSRGERTIPHSFSCFIPPEMHNAIISHLGRISPTIFRPKGGGCLVGGGEGSERGGGKRRNRRREREVEEGEVKVEEMEEISLFALPTLSLVP